MSDLVVLLLVLVTSLQLSAWPLVRYDAKRLSLKQPLKYEPGIIVPTAGFVVLLYSLANRRDLPKVGPNSPPE
ncbi:hypothetical protein [Natrinema sp. DC36]|uniref:hypothetical protein n=1 Tax=Natrinema sp. DC36 TaxID=2878680 RepID=UPI001CF013C4|nr:hypothetical protein [Natrinema sp. DC36]